MDGKTATGDGFAVTSHSLDSTAQMLELAYTTNGTPQIAAIAGEFLSAQIVGEEAAETQATETSGTIQIEVPQNTGLLRSGSVTLSLAEDESRTVYDLDLPVGGGTDVREVIIDVHACGVEAGENIELMFELTTSWLGWFDVLDDLTVRVSFNELSSMIGQELTDHVGERFYIEASNNGECWFGPIPASGNIEAELV